MTKQLKALVFAGFLAAVLAGGASAQSWCNGTGTSYYFYDGSYSPYSNGTCHGWTSTGSGHVFGVNMYWNQSGRNGVQNYVADGKRYTHDMTDLNNNLSATGTYSTNFPSPYIDFDDDDGNGEWEEWEVTVENSNFPTVGTKYYIQFWSSWQASSGASGNVAYTPAISKKKCGICPGDKWNTDKYDKGLKRHYSRLGNLFELEEKSPLEHIFDLKKENENEKQIEHRRFIEPVSIDEFAQQTDVAGIKVRGYALEYEVDSEDGPQIVTVGLVPTGDEFVPTSTLEEVLNSLPDTFKVTRFRGVVSYYFDSAELGDSAEK